ncbi:MAG: hypothetical protein AAF823_12505 [Planctomycetota bacterium]
MPIFRKPSQSTSDLLASGVIAIAAASTLAPAAYADEVLYRETFANTSGAGASLDSVGWTYYLGPQGWSQDSNAATQGMINEQRGAAADGSPVGSGTDDATELGYLINTLGPDGVGDDPYWNQVTLYVTEEPAIDLAEHPIAELRVDLAFSQPDTVRFVVRVDGRWFASQTAIEAQTIAGYGLYDKFQAEHSDIQLHVADAAWLPLSFMPGVTLGLDTSAPAVALPAKGTLDAVGLLIDPTGFEAFDNFEVIGHGH